VEVFEHVQDYPAALREIRRVLRPGGFALNVFPSRYTPLEPHVLVPFATVIQSRRWLAAWAHLGVRNSFQHGLSASETASKNERFLREETNYLPAGEILRLAREVFPSARFLPSERLASSARLHYLARFPPAGCAYAAFRSRTLLLA
jgi:ubiquinone/menaquinone biosynthesis C-methylase UbiE